MNALFIPRANRGFLAMAISALFVPGAMAGPDNCTASNGGSTLTCEGNQSQGVNVVATPPNALVIQNLTQPITTSKNVKTLRKIVRKPKFVCGKCARSANDKSYLCQPLRLKEKEV